MNWMWRIVVVVCSIRMFDFIRSISVIIAYLNDANSMGFTSTRPLTMTEHNEKNSDDSVASMMPKCGQEHDRNELVILVNVDRSR